jgi:hypothetical protein
MIGAGMRDKEGHPSQRPALIERRYSGNEEGGGGIFFFGRLRKWVGQSVYDNVYVAKLLFAL